MQLNLSAKELRLLLDLVYIGNWVLNSTRGSDRFWEYDQVQSRVFSCCPHLAVDLGGLTVPSQEYVEGGIHEAISYYEDNIFYEILAEELSRRDMDYPEIDEDNYPEIARRMQDYMQEFELSGVDHLKLEE